MFLTFHYFNVFFLFFFVFVLLLYIYIYINIETLYRYRNKKQKLFAFHTPHNFIYFVISFVLFIYSRNKSFLNWKKASFFTKMLKAVLQYAILLKIFFIQYKCQDKNRIHFINIKYELKYELENRFKKKINFFLKK